MSTTRSRSSAPWWMRGPTVVMHQLTDLPRVFDRRSGACGGLPAQCAHPHRGHAQSGRRRAGRRGAALHRAERRVRLCARQRALCRDRSAQCSPMARRGGDGRAAADMEEQVLGVRHGGHRAALRSALRPRHLERRPRAQAAAPRRCRRPGRVAGGDPRATGIYNIADDDGTVSIEKARRELGFDPAFRLAA